MIFKFSLTFFCEPFFADEILSAVKGEHIVLSREKIDHGTPDGSQWDAYEFITFWHPRKFSTEENVVAYEGWFVEFLKLNGSALIAGGGKDISLFMEVYYDGGQCNFEIFNKGLLKRLAEFNVSLPISVYALDQKEYEKWEGEIKQEWAGHDS